VFAEGDGVTTCSEPIGIPSQSTSSMLAAATTSLFDFGEFVSSIYSQGRQTLTSTRGRLNSSSTSSKPSERTSNYLTPLPTSTTSSLGFKSNYSISVTEGFSPSTLSSPSITQSPALKNGNLSASTTATFPITTRTPSKSTIATFSTVSTSHVSSSNYSWSSTEITSQMTSQSPVTQSTLLSNSTGSATNKLPLLPNTRTTRSSSTKASVSMVPTSRVHNGSVSATSKSHLLPSKTKTSSSSIMATISRMPTSRVSRSTHLSSSSVSQPHRSSTTSQNTLLGNSSTSATASIGAVLSTHTAVFTYRASDSGSVISSETFVHRNSSVTSSQRTPPKTRTFTGSMNETRSGAVSTPTLASNTISASSFASRSNATVKATINEAVSTKNISSQAKSPTESVSRSKVPPTPATSLSSSSRHPIVTSTSPTRSISSITSRTTDRLSTPFESSSIPGTVKATSNGRYR
jgi:trimeric autotransporter adhesin